MPACYNPGAMADNPPRPQRPRVAPTRPSAYTSVDARGEVVVPTESEDEQRVAITLNVIDGFQFGCGLLLAGVGFGFALIVVVAVAVVVSAILGIPLPFSGAAP